MARMKVDTIGVPDPTGTVFYTVEWVPVRCCGKTILDFPDFWWDEKHLTVTQAPTECPTCQRGTFTQATLTLRGYINTMERENGEENHTFKPAGEE